MSICAPPTRLLRRQFLLLVLWSLACYGLYRFGGSEEVLTPGPGSHSRQILQQQPPEVTTDAVPLERLLGLQPLVDTSPARSERQVLESVKQTVPNLPVDFWARRAGRTSRVNSTCAKLPAVYDIKFNNIYWQVLETSNGTYNFYGAYYDNRPALAISPLVRILVMIDRLKPTLMTFCQLWFDQLSFPVIAPVIEYKYVWYEKWGNYEQGILQPYLMACQVPAAFRLLVPQAVTVVERPCDTSTVALRVVNNRPADGRRKDFAVCVKGLSFPDEDISVRLVEWLETLRVLGARKVFMYELEVHPNISKVLLHYQREGLVEVTPLTLAGEQPNLSRLQQLYLRKRVTNRRQSELVPYNDCFYRNLYTYEYVALLDTDEIIMPTAYSSWSDLMTAIVPRADRQARTRGKAIASYNARNVYFFDQPGHGHSWQPDIPRYMHMLQHVQRSRNYTKPGQFVKCFHRTERVVALHNHFPLACLGGCLSYSISTSEAQLQHYRADCVGPLKKTCEDEYRRDSVFDTAIWRYKEVLTARATRTLVTLGFLPPEGEQLAEFFQSGRSAASADQDSGLAENTLEAAESVR